MRHNFIPKFGGGRFEVRDSGIALTAALFEGFEFAETADDEVDLVVGDGIGAG